MAKYTIREAHESDISGIVKLRMRIKEYEALEYEDYDLFWKGLIWDNPCLLRKALVAVNDKGRVLAHYAAVPFKFYKEGESLLGGFVCQLMVDKDHRQEFIFPRMMLKMTSSYRKLGINFAYSLSSRPDVVRAHQAFGFRKIGELSVYARPYRLRKIVPHVVQSKPATIALTPLLPIADQFLRIKKYRIKEDLTVREIPRFDENIDSFLNKIQYQFPYSIIRNAEILNWRTVDFPLRKYRILIAEAKGKISGYAILRQMKMKNFDVLAIVDIMYSPEKPDRGAALLTAVHEMAIDAKVDMTSCLLSPHDPFYPMFKKCGFFKTPEKIALFVHEPKGENSDLSGNSFNKWHITWFDHDSM